MFVRSLKIGKLVCRAVLILLVAFFADGSTFGEPYPETRTASTQPSSDTNYEQEEIIKLIEGKAIERELLPGTTHLYSVDLNAGEFVEISIDQRGVDVVVMLFLDVQGDGKKLTEVDSPSGMQGKEPLYWVAETAGKYVVSVLHLDAKAPAGKYAITLVGKRQPTEVDRDRYRAQQAVVTAQIAMAQKTVESFTQAAAEYKIALELYRELGETWRELIVGGRLGETLAGLQKYDEAIGYYKQALAVAEAQGHALYIPFLQLRIGQAYENSKLPDAQKHRLALDYFRQAAGGFRAEQDTELQAYLFGQIGHHENALKMSDQAVASFTRSAELYQKINKKAEAAKQLEALASVLESSDRAAAMATYTRAAELYKQAGDSTKAETSANAAAAIKEKLDWADVLRQWQDLQKQITGTITAEQKKQIETFIAQFQRTLINEQQMESDIRFGAELYFELGRAFSLLGEKTKAAVYFRQAARRFDESGEYERADAIREPPGKTSGPLPQLVTQYGHTDRIVKVALSEDGKFLASMGLDGSIKIWDTDTGLILETLKREIGVSTNSPSRGTDLLFVADGDIWNVGRGELIRKVSFSRVIFDVDSTTFGFVSGARRFVAFNEISFDKGSPINVFDATSGRFLFLLRGHGSSVSVVAFSGHLLASGATNGEVKIWDLEKRKLLIDLEAQAAKITDLTFSTDGRTLIAETEDKVSKRFDIADGRILTNENVEVADGGTGCTMESRDVSSPGGEAFARIEEADEEKNTAKLVVRDSKTCAVLSRLEYSLVQPGGDYGEIGDDEDNIAFADDGQTVASGSGKAINLWNYRTGKLMRRLEGFGAKPSSVNFSPDGKYLNIRDAGYYQVFQSPDPYEKLEQDVRSFSRLDLRSGAIASTVTRPLNEYLISPDFRFGLFHRPRLRVYQYKDLQTDRVVAQIPDGFSNIVFSPDSRRFVTYEYRGPAQLRDSETARVIKQFNNFKTFGFSPDGKTLIGLSADETRGGIFSFDAVTGRALGQLQVDDEVFDILVTASIVTGIKISADRKRFTVTESGVSGKNGGAFLYNAEAKSDLGSISGGSGFPYLSFSHDSRFLAAENNDSEINLIDTSNGQILDVLLGHTTDLRGLDFSDDDRFLVSSSEDGTIQFWRVETSELAATLYMFEDGEWLVTTPDGFFDGTPAAWRRVYWRFHDGDSAGKFALAPVEIFFNDFYRPGVLAEIMAGNSPQSSLEIAKLDRRQPKVCISVAKKGASEVCKTGNAIQTVSDRTVDVAVEVEEAPEASQKSLPAGGVRDVRLFRGGSLVKHWKGDVFDKASGCDVIPATPRKTICRTTVTITAGTNDLSAYAFNNHNVKSADATIHLKGAASLKKPGTFYILAVGVNKYADATNKNDLKYAVADVEKIGQQLAAQQIGLKRYAKTEVVKLTNENATKENILLALARFARGGDASDLPEAIRLELSKINKSQPEDAILFHFSGHGTARCETDVRSNKKNCDRFYLLPHDGFENNYAHAISDEDLENYFESIDAGKLLMVIDACNSGQALEAEEKRRGPMNSRGLAQLAYEKGIFILTASQSQQAALETNRLGHGLLTYSLLQGLLKAEKSTSGEIIDRSWFNYAAVEVPKLQLDEMQKREAANARPGTTKGPKLFFVPGDDRNLPPEKRGLQSPRIFYRREAESNPLVVAKRP